MVLRVGWVEAGVCLVVDEEIEIQGHVLLVVPAMAMVVVRVMEKIENAELEILHHSIAVVDLEGMRPLEVVRELEMYGFDLSGPIEKVRDYAGMKIIFKQKRLKDPMSNIKFDDIVHEETGRIEKKKEHIEKRAKKFVNRLKRRMYLDD